MLYDATKLTLVQSHICGRFLNPSRLQLPRVRTTWMLVDELMWDTTASGVRASDESGVCQWCRHPQRLQEPPPRRQFWSNGAEHGGCRAPWPQWPQDASAADTCDNSMVDLAQALQTDADPDPPPPPELQLHQRTSSPSPWRYSGGQLPVSTSLAVHYNADHSRVSGCSPI